MLKANELRIGNAVLNPSNNQICFISSMDISDIENRYKDRNPIPLTPEVLEKCGFNHKSNNEYVKDNLVFRILQNDLILHGFEYDYNGVILNRPESLHQLQNLYFALTGTELEYKP